MKKVKIFAVAAAMVATMVSVAGAESKVTGDVYAGFYNKYLFRGIDSSGNQGVIQGGADLTYKGLTLSVWNNFQTAKGNTNYDSNSITETDLVLNYAFSPIELLSVNVGDVYYSYNPLSGLNNTNELYLKTTVNTLLSPTLAINWDYDEAKKAGFFYALSVGHTIEVTKQLGVNLGALASYNQKNYSTSELYSGLHNYELSVSADYALTDSIKISPSYLYSNAISHKARELAGLRNESLFGIKAAFNF